ncbi:hypothetical protein LR48_Vigan681s000300 [Vigna angularis]|uniref:Uncharacterized protein n=1 Tax=Phaseolus angularis TaxID=3914 RepID=A0A0L9TG40_PHAAN|nr:hypothetical protein LR48_Vigan681s000300 [Vigna angularis]
MELEKNSKSAKEEKPQVPLNASLLLSGTEEHPLAPLRGESVAEGKNPTHALTAERQFTIEQWYFGLSIFGWRRRKTHFSPLGGRIGDGHGSPLLFLGCNSDKNLTIWALNSTKVISTIGGNLNQAWIKVNFGKLPDNLRINHNNNGSNNPLYRKEGQRWRTHFNSFLQVSISTQKNIEASCKRMEMNLRYISQRLDDFKVNTEVNPKEEDEDKLISPRDRV